MTGVTVPTKIDFYPNPYLYLGQMKSDPSNPSPGQWWYRVDTGQIRMYTQNGIVSLQYQSTEIISNNTTIGGTNVNITTRLVVLPGVTLTIYGTVIFTQDLVVFGTLLSSNPSASSSSPATNSYNLRGNLYLDGTYSIAQYNTDQINYLGGLSFIQSLGSFLISGTLAFNTNLTLSIPFGVSGSGTLAVNSGYTLTISTNITFDVSTISVSGTLTVSANTTFSVSTISGTGTLSIVSGYTLTISGNVTFTMPTISGTGSLSIASGYTLIVNSNATFAVSTVSGAGTLVTNSGYTLTFSGSTLTPGTLIVNGTLALSGNYTLGTDIPNVAGTLQINSGYTLTVSSNLTLVYSAITGAGTLSIVSGYTLTQAAAVTLSVSTILVAGTWANAGYGITIPSGTTVTWNVSGSVTTGSTAGTLTVNGTCYWYGAGITTITSASGMPTFVLSLVGTGIFIAAPAGQGTATATISFSATSIAKGSTGGSATGSGGIPYYSLTAVKGNAVGLYSIGTEDISASSYPHFVLIYIGTANITYSVSGYFGYTAADKSGDTIYALNASSSVGTITLTGTLYV